MWLFLISLIQASHLFTHDKSIQYTDPLWFDSNDMPFGSLKYGGVLCYQSGDLVPTQGCPRNLQSQQTGSLLLLLSPSVCRASRDTLFLFMRRDL